MMAKYRLRSSGFVTCGVTNFYSFAIICISGLVSICGAQQLVWLYSPPSPSHYYVLNGVIKEPEFEVVQQRVPVNDQWSRVTTVASHGQISHNAPPVVAVTSSNYRCKQNTDRFHSGTDKCYRIGSRGPCGPKMVFTARNNVNGVCQCDNDNFELPLVQIGNQCHLLFTQATCQPGHWLILKTANGSPTCQHNPCLAIENFHRSFGITEYDRNRKMILFRGKCVFLNDPAPCNRKDEQVVFPVGSVEPACDVNTNGRKRLRRRQIASIHAFPCGEGMRRHRITQKCVKIMTRAIVFSSSG